MFLTAWEARLKGTTYGGDRLFDPAITLTAALTCPSCSRSHPDVEVTYRLCCFGMSDERPTEPKLRQNFEFYLTSFRKLRDCEECGVLSVMPRGDVAELEKQMKERLTLEWLLNEKERLVADQRKKTA